MNILAFVASPRKGSNTDTLVDETLRVRAKIDSHFRIPSPGHLWPCLNHKILEIVLLFLWFCSIGATKSNLNPGANSVNLFLREPQALGQLMNLSPPSEERYESHSSAAHVSRRLSPRSSGHTAVGRWGRP